MAHRSAYEVEKAGQAESMDSSPTIADNRFVEQVRVPAMPSVGKMKSVDDLDLEFDEEVEERILQEVEEAELSPAIKDIVEDDGVLGDRSLFTWKWEWYIFGEPLTLGCVPDEYAQEAQEAKTLMGLYVTLIDDIGEQHNDGTTFWELAKTAYPGAEPDWEHDDIDPDYAQSVRRVWEELVERLRSAPRYDEFSQPFMFNLRSNIQAMEYAYQSADNPALMNPEETWHYDTQAIGLDLFWCIDLMYSPQFEYSDFRTLRQLIYELQHMWRLGNWIITWEREIHEHDYSAGIFVEALNQSIISESDLQRLENGKIEPERLIGRIEVSGIVEQFIADWQRRRDRLYERDFEMKSLDSNELVGMMEWLMQNHLATEGYR